MIITLWIVIAALIVLAINFFIRSENMADERDWNARNVDDLKAQVQSLETRLANQSMSSATSYTDGLVSPWPLGDEAARELWVELHKRVMEHQRSKVVYAMPDPDAYTGPFDPDERTLYETLTKRFVKEAEATRP